MLYSIDGTPSFRINLYQTSVASKWKNLIKESFVGDGKDIDSRRSFYHLQSKIDIRKDLLKSIGQINNFLKFNFIKLPKNIDWNSNDFYNELHLYFEKLSGEFDNPTKLFKIAPEHIKESIRDLNYCIHTLENYDDGIANDIKQIKIQWTKSREKTKRIKLKDEEYAQFQFTMKTNEVYLGYNELGKNYIELWQDNLPIDYANLKNSHYIGNDIVISLKNVNTIFRKDFIRWMTNNNFDVFDKKLGIGLLPIGTCEIIDISHLTKDSKLDIIVEEEEKI